MICWQHARWDSHIRPTPSKNPSARLLLVLEHSWTLKHLGCAAEDWLVLLDNIVAFCWTDRFPAQSSHVDVTTRL